MNGEKVLSFIIPCTCDISISETNNREICSISACACIINQIFQASVFIGIVFAYNRCIFMIQHPMFWHKEKRKIAYITKMCPFKLEHMTKIISKPIGIIFNRINKECINIVALHSKIQRSIQLLIWKVYIKLSNLCIFLLQREKVDGNKCSITRTYKN